MVVSLLAIGKARVKQQLDNKNDVVVHFEVSRKGLSRGVNTKKREGNHNERNE